MPDFIESFPLADLKPAAYNPRHLSAEAFDELKASIARFGVVKPVIANKDGTIVAGHQRTKAMLALGITHAPVVILDRRAGIVDEINFNLMHNSVESMRGRAAVPPSETTGWAWLDWSQVIVDDPGQSRHVTTTGKLLAKFGPWGAVIADAESGRVLANVDYAVACSRIRYPVLCFYVPAAQAADLAATLARDFGVYDPSKVIGDPWTQYALQPTNRLAVKTTSEIGHQFRSLLYENVVIPNITRETRVLDFGAGRQAYALMLKSEGFRVFPYEPFLTRTQGKRAVFDIEQIVLDIRAVERDYRQHGPFDMTVLDSVINAATSDDYQRWILAATSALTHPDGSLVLATRNLLTETKNLESEGAGASYRIRNSYLSPDGKAVTFYQGQWIMMNYHTWDSLKNLLERWFADVEMLNPQSTQGMLQAVCRKPRAVDLDLLRDALDREFNMKYPGDYQHGRHSGLIDAVMERYAQELPARLHYGKVEA